MTNLKAEKKLFLLHESPITRLYLKKDSEANQFLVKVLNKEFPSAEDIRQFYNEFDILQACEIDGVRKILKKTEENNHPALELQYITGKTLLESIKDLSSIGKFLEIAIQIAEVLSRIHLANIVHLDINPQNIIISEDNRIYIIDFAYAQSLNSRSGFTANPDKIRGTLNYIAPEQTGRMNRIVDYRVDLYSLGISFYQLLSNKLPFQSDDPIEIIHSHIAKIAVPLNQLDKNIPEALSNIVKKLMEKEADHRYQSAVGLIADLKSCLSQWKKSRVIDLFSLGTKDRKHHFTLPQKLYGREKAINTIWQLYNDTCIGGSKLIMVSGYSGVGKSALVSEIQNQIINSKGVFVSGKFDQYQNPIPHYAFQEASKQLVNLLMAEEDSFFTALKEKLTKSLGDEVVFLTHIIPNISYLIKVYNRVIENGVGIELQPKLNYLYSQFISTIASSDRPIVFFIDDLQWADSSSLDLLKYLCNQRIPYFLIIGAYRDNEVGEAHPLKYVINSLRNNFIEIHDVAVQNLTTEHISHFISDVLNQDSKDVEELSQLLDQKTNGNPFFLKQFIEALYKKGFIAYDPGLNIWSFDQELLKNTDMTDNVIQLMSEKIESLAPSVENCLKLAACIGNQFELRILSIISEYEIEQLKELMRIAESEGLIIESKDAYRFIHDKIQQSAYQLIPQEARNQTHLKIARLLLSEGLHEEGINGLFEVTDHYNKGISQINLEERSILLELNFKAAKAAVECTAYQQSVNYIQIAILLMPDRAWETNYELSLQLYTLGSEATYLNKDLTKMYEFIEIVEKNCANHIDAIKALEIKIKGLVAQNRLRESLNVGLFALESLGIKFPQKPKMHHVLLALLKTKSVVYFNGQNLEQIPKMETPEAFQKIKMLYEVLPSAYWVDANTMVLIIFKMMRFSVLNGNYGLSYYTYTAYGAILCELGEIEQGYDIGKVGFKLSNFLEARDSRCRIWFNFICFVQHWKEPLEDSIELYLKAYHIGLETGSNEFASFSLYFYVQYLYHCGKNLNLCIIEFDKSNHIINQLGSNTPLNYQKIHHQAALNFISDNQQPWILEGDIYKESLMIKVHQDEEDQTALFKLNFQKMMLQCFFGKYADAVKSFVIAKPYAGSVTAQYCKNLFVFYEAIARFGHYPELTNTKQKGKYLKEIKNCISKIKKWSKYVPENYLHKYFYLKAEWYKLKGKLPQAFECYLSALKLAKKAGFLHEEALIYESTGKFFYENSKLELAEWYLRSAYQSYRIWGASGKLNQLKDIYPHFNLSQSTFSSNVSLSDSFSYSSFGSDTQWDVSALLKASTSLSGEVILNNLLAKLMNIVVENAGAQRGIIVLNRNNELSIETQYSDIADEVLNKKIQLKDSGLLAESIITYVSRSNEYVIIKDASTDARFQNDSYIKQKKPVSVLCLPIIHLGELLGLLYLENNLMQDAFSQERIELLRLLSGQMAISIHNALLYDELENKVSERTLELENEKKKTDDLLYNILPYETAKEIKANGFSVPRHFENVSVLFTDFKNFTLFSSNMDPTELVAELDIFFREFDMICERNRLEKIKTIGDAYMAVAGLPIEQDDHALNAVNAALEIRDYVSQRKKEKLGNSFDIRIGIHSGPVVAGIVGQKKFQYDIWGDTVNIASRMESNSIEGKVNISSCTFELIKEEFKCDPRGEIEVKGKGKLNMYFTDYK